MSAATDPVTITTLGAVEGAEEDGLWVFRGIPFAAPPAGDLRWQAARPHAGWDGVRCCQAYGASSPQPFNPQADPILGGHGFPPFDEDCLTLNVWTPGLDDSRRPVLVWIHGGGFLTGSGSLPYYAGDTFARDGDLVVVTINYRLGALGFLVGLGDSANLWLTDQIVALRWVFDNVAAFGGDPAQITLAGQSGGAFSIAALAGHPQSAGQFQRAILQSAPLGVTLANLAAAQDRAVFLAEVLGHSDPAALRSEPWERLVEGTIGVLMRTSEFGEWGLAFTPAHDEATLSRPVADSLADSDVEVLIGWNRDEATFRLGLDPSQRDCTREQVVEWAHRRHGARAEALVNAYLGLHPGRQPGGALIDILTDDLFRTGAFALADHRAGSRPVHAYQFELRSRAYDGALGATHCLEIPFVFGNSNRWTSLPVMAGMPHDVVERITAVLHPAWIAFAHTGDPTHENLREWPQHTASRETLVVNDDAARVEQDPAAAWLAARAEVG